MADLVTLPALKLALDITDATLDAKLQQIIEDVSDAIRGHCGRDFATDTAADTKTYHYDGNGYLEVDDLVPGSITEVTVDGVALTAGSYVEEPVEGPVTTWLELPAAYGMSPAMGFTRNLDKIAARSGPHVVTIIATFGWPDVPGSVRRAAIWTAEDWLANPDGDISESIEGYSHARAPDSTGDAIPERAQLLLERFVRVSA